MNSERWTKIQQIFETALEKNPEERNTWLKNTCGADMELYNEVISLLQADGETHSLLRSPAYDLLGFAETLLMDEKHIGIYRLKKQIGLGGMGAVYLAERDDGQFEQKVALKVIKPGMDSQEILRRFQRERQILAHLQHPNIARLLDGGITEKGLPFFTLEYVDGKPINHYCDEKRLSIQQRLTLFMKVCEAVQYAHQNLIIHRDLKPSNIMITDEGQVKLLDFGIATLLTSEGNRNMTMLTGEGNQVLTPEYASPEQVRGLNITTASDIYSLGIVLYQLLCGHKPYEIKEYSPIELDRVISQSVIRKPSLMVKPGETEEESESASLSVADLRSTNTDRLQKQLRGDLDNICLLALQKEPERRYGTVDQLANDIHRHLSGLPVLARPSTTRYRLQKFAERHRSGIWTALIIIFMIVGLVGFYTSRLAQERDLASLEARKAAQIAEFMTGIFEISDPGESRGENITARELLERGARRIDQELSEQPEVRAMMMDVVGGVYRNLGLYARAADQLEKSLELKTEIYGPDHVEMVRTLELLGSVFVYQRRDSLARSTLNRGFAILQDLSSEYTTEKADILYDLGWLYNENGKLDSAEACYDEALKLYEFNQEKNRKKIAVLRNNIALSQHEQGHFDRAEKLYRQALAAQIELFGPDHPEVATTKYNMSQLLWDIGKYEESEALKREVVEMDRKMLGNHHPDLAYSLANLAKMYEYRGLYDSSEVLFREALEIRKEALGPEHPQVIFSLNEMGGLLRIKEKYKEAEKIHRQALALALKTWGENHTEVARSYRLLGEALHAQGKNREAAEYFEKSLVINSRARDTDHPYYAHSLLDLGMFLQDQGNLPRAQRLFREARSIYEKNYGTEHPAVAAALNRMGMTFQALGEKDSAEACYQKSIDIYRKKLSPLNPGLAYPLLGLGSLYLEENNPARAEPLLREALKIRLARLPKRHWRTALTQSVLGECLARTGKSGEAEPLLRTGYTILNEKRGPDNPFTREAKERWERFEKPGRN